MRSLPLIMLLAGCATTHRTYTSIGCPVTLELLPNGSPDVEAIQLASIADLRCQIFYGDTSCVSKIIRRPGEHNFWVLCGRMNR